jgi:RNA polymerase sigma-54 factor
MAMEFSQGMSMRMDQRQILTPRMIQSMEILQMPVMALEERIDQEMQANPTLDLKHGKDEPRGPAEMDYGAGENSSLTIDPNSADGKEFSRLEKLADYLSNEEWATNDGPRYRGRVGGDEDRDGKMDALANSAARTGSLSQHLLDQWSLLDDLTPELDRAGRHVINFLDADGYLRTPMQELIDAAPFASSFPATSALLDKALRLVQTLDPTGVGARNLSECLRLQLDAMEEDEELAEGHDFPLERSLVNFHLEDLAQNRYPQISKRLGVSIDAIKLAVRRLARLTPHPGRQFAPNDAPPITPDATIYLDEATNKYEIKMRNDPSDNLYVKKKYRMMLADKSVDKKTREFLSDKVRSARWLMDAIAQRKSTISRVIRVVVDAQQEFFEKGPEFLKPLPMIGVADQLGIHVATVSRAVSEKYIETPVGIFPLRRFFSMGTTDSSGKEMSWDAVKEKIRQIIENEDKDNPLNDDEIVDKVKEQGIDLARRTVAKYRKILNIPTARQRKQF